MTILLLPLIVPWLLADPRCQSPPLTNRISMPRASALPPACPAAATAYSGSSRPAAPAISPADGGRWPGPDENRLRPAAHPGRPAAAATPLGADAALLRRNAPQFCLPA